MTSGAQGPAGRHTPLLSSRWLPEAGLCTIVGPTMVGGSAASLCGAPVARKVKVGLAGKPPSGSGWEQGPEKYARLTHPLHHV